MTLYRAFINGKRVGHDQLTPGWTRFDKRVQYQTYDVTGLVRKGGNAVGVALGNGSGWSVGGTTVPTQPIYAYPTGRTWWPEAASAASFETPQPPTG